MAGKVSKIESFYAEHKSELWFGLILSVCIVLSHWMSRWIPVTYFEEVVTPILNATQTAVCLFGAYLMYKHSKGMRIRKIWGAVMVIWGPYACVYRPMDAHPALCL